jgi:hypothetical protein
MEFFEENVKPLEKNYVKPKEKNWIKKVQKTLTKHNSAKKHKNENLAFKLLCEKAPVINKHLTDIQAFQDLYVDKDEEIKLSRIKEAERLVKVMGDIAADLNIDCYTDSIRSLLYDMEKGGLQNRGGGLLVEVKLDNLSEEQLKLTPFIWSSHLPPEEQGSGS